MQFVDAELAGEQDNLSEREIRTFIGKTSGLSNEIENRFRYKIHCEIAGTEPGASLSESAVIGKTAF